MPGGISRHELVSLKLADDINAMGTERARVLAFDDIYGAVLLDDTKGNYRTIQY